MSVKVMAAVWEMDLARADKLVLLAFADHADDDGICYPSVARIAWKTGYSERSIQRVLRRLEAAEILAIVEPGGAGQRATTVYRVDPAKGDNLAPFGSARATTPSAKSDTRVPVRATPVSPEPSENHHEPPRVATATELVDKWAELTGAPLTRSLRRQWYPQAVDFVAAAVGGPLDGDGHLDRFLEFAHDRGCRTPAGLPHYVGEYRRHRKVAGVDPDVAARAKATIEAIRRGE